MMMLGEIKPEVVVHELTAIPERLNVRHFDRDFELTNRLRTEGTDNLIAGARAAGTRRFVAQSYAAWPYSREGRAIKSETDELDQKPPAAMRKALQAIRHLEAAVLGAKGMKGVVLRYGAFYGPGTSFAQGSVMIDELRRRKFPIIGSGSGIWSFIHVDDAAEATVAAIERDVSGIYNVTDDDAAAVSEWLPVLAAAVKAPPPRRVPRLLARLIVGEPGVVLMTQIRGASNAKAKRELGWRPGRSSWRIGFREILGRPGDPGGKFLSVGS
jgi:nucleoside-diphosphate-sugar epimerase